MAQEREGLEDSTKENEKELGDEGSFVSPEESQGLLATLDKQDRRVLDKAKSDETDYEGEFLSPQDVEASSAHAAQAPQAIPAEQARLRSGGDPSLLSRIASELHSIKSELSHLKISYDDMLSQSSITSAAESPKLPPIAGVTPPSPPRAQERAQELAQKGSSHSDVSGELYPDLKKLLVYLDKLLESLPEEKIDLFARSEYFDLYRKVFEYFDLV